jgi:choline kinase
MGVTQSSSSTKSKKLIRSVTAVSIDEPDMISPMMLGKNKETHDNFNLDGQSSSRQFSAKLGKRLHGRHNAQQVPDTPATTSSSVYDGSNDIAELGGSGHGVHHVFKDIHAWLHEEKVRRKARKAQRKHRGLRKGSHLKEVKEDEVQESSANDRRLSESSSSGDSDAFERLQGILERSASGNILDRNGSKKQSVKVGRRSSTKKSRVYSSDVDVDIDDAPPSCNVILDNSKTLTYYGGSSSTHADITAKPASKDDREEWLNFKSEIVRLAHTLKLKGWRQVPLEQYANIDVERLSGALTNAVYVIAPPEDQYLKPTETADGSQSLAPRKPPPYVSSEDV